MASVRHSLITRFAGDLRFCVFCETRQTGSVVLSARRRVSRSAVSRDANHPTELIAFTRSHSRPDGPAAEDFYPFPSTAGGGRRVVADCPLNKTGLTGSEKNPAQHPDSLSTSYDETTWKSHGTIIQQPSVVIRIVIFKQDAIKDQGSVLDVLILARLSLHIVVFFTLSSHIWLKHAYISQCVLRCHCESD